MATAMKVPDCPKDIKFEDVVTTVQCHPSRNLVASGLISGDIFIHSFSAEGENTKVQQFGHHKKTCRALQFSEDGRHLLSASKDKTVLCVDVQTGRLKRKIKNAHESPIYCMAITGDKFVATGDDDGVLKVWDMRTKTATMELKECEDFISDMIVEDQKKIIAASGEGTLTCFNIRQKKMESQSELFDSELLCLSKMKNGRKLVCGTSEGVLNVFNWGQWGNISDRFPCGQAQIDSVVAVTEDILCVGTNDGFIRALHIQPNRALGVVGQHDNEFPVEAMSLTFDTTCVASCSHDQRVKFWNVEELKSQTVDTSKKASKQARTMVKFGTARTNNFFSDLVGETSSSGGQANGDDEDDDDDDDSD